MDSGTMFAYLLDIRMQLACFIILQFIVWTFFSVMRKRTYANRLFSALMLTTILNVLLDMATVYTLGHISTVPLSFSRVLYTIYVVSSVSILYVTYLYVKSITIELSPKPLEFLPVILSVLSAALLPTEFVQTEHGLTIARGMGVSVPYMSAAAYFIVCIILLIHFRKHMEPKVKRGIITALISLFIVTVIQTVQHDFLISSVGYTVIVIALFYTLESPDALLIEKLAYERNRANEANRAKSAFLANMSHEIRTPINAIVGMDEMILRESRERETLTYASDIQAASRTLLSLVNEILDFSKVEEGKMEILPTQYELHSVINDLVNMVSDRAEKKGLRFDVALDETTPHLLYGDAIRIRQCVLNILTNAVKYTDSGSVTLAISYQKLNDKAISLRFCVSDTGIGIKSEDMERLFSPFARIEETRNQSIEGTGLGMSITKQLIELMGSTLHVESVYGKGSEFSFSIEQPVIRWDPIGPFTTHDLNVHPSTYRELFHAPEAHILVVDDTPVNLTVIRGLLKKTQIVIDTAFSGPEAIRMASQQAYDIVFIDHMMPEMDGIETLHELEKIPQLKNTVFVALTANAISGAREMYINEGFADYLSKPVDGVRLENMLVSYLPAEKLSAPTAPQSKSCDVRPFVLIADDDDAVQASITSLLADSYRTFVCRTPAEIAEQAGLQKVALILLGIRLNGASGFEALQMLKHDANTRDIPVVLLTDEENPDIELLGLRNGADDFIRKAYLSDVLTRRVRRTIEISRIQSELQNEVKRQILRTERLSREMMLTLSKAVDSKDHFTSGHSERVAAYSAEIARRLGKSLQEQETIYEASLLHDVGKIGVSEEILNRPGVLSEEDRAAIRRHTIIGSEILSSISEMPRLAQSARFHHEWFDGSGYPDGLKRADIPEIARIICVADCYDAMTSTRTYSPVKSREEVRSEIERCSGSQFDPKIARVMLTMIDEDVDFHMNEKSCGIEVWKNHKQLWALTQMGSDTVPPPDAPESLPDWLYHTEGLDVFAGLRCCGSPESYLEVLKVYAETAAANADEIAAYWHAGDLQSATVKVHALKSTSKTIGATQLGAFAQRLEDAGKAGNAAVFGADIDSLLLYYRSLSAQLEPLLDKKDDDESLPLIDSDQLHEAYDAIREFTEAHDYQSVAFTLDSLRSYRIPPEDRSRFERLMHAVKNFDWDQIGDILN